MNVKNVKIADITPYNKNAKKHDKTQIANVAESIKQYGFVQPVVMLNDPPKMVHRSTENAPQCRVEILCAENNK